MRASLPVLLLLAACSIGASPVEAGPPDASDAADAADARVCSVDVATYCAVRACPGSLAEAVAQLCAESPEVVVCGGTVSEWGIDVGTSYDFDDAGDLRMIVGSSIAGSKCVAGPSDASVLPWCGTNAASVCPYDAGAD